MLILPFLFIHQVLFAFSSRDSVIDKTLLVFWKGDCNLIAYLDSWSKIEPCMLAEVRSIHGSVPMSIIRFNIIPEKKEELLNAFRNSQCVQTAQWDSKIELRSTPNDSLYSKQWHLPFTKVKEAWDISNDGLTFSGDTIVVGIIDAGFDIRHPDIEASVFINKFETAGDMKDNDMNGYIDDLYGWNFIDDTNTFTADVHGTAVAGIMGAVGNNLTGVCGISRKLKMIFCSVETVSDVIQSYYYLLDFRRRYNSSDGKNGAFIVAVNASIGISDAFCRNHPVWGDVYNLLGKEGIISVAAVSNNGKNIDVSGDMPSSCQSPFLITTMSNDSFGRKLPSSAYGKYSVDVAAPGQSVLTTFPGSAYQYFNGNSAAAPIVCGAIALLYSVDCSGFSEAVTSAPEACALLVKDAILLGVTGYDDFSNANASGGVLNVLNSMNQLNRFCQDTIENELRIKEIFPVPCNEGFQISYHTGADKNVQLMIYDGSGRLIDFLELNNNDRIAVNNAFIDTALLPCGIYYIVLINNFTKDGRIFIKQ